LIVILISLKFYALLLQTKRLFDMVYITYHKDMLLNIGNVVAFVVSNGGIFRLGIFIFILANHPPILNNHNFNWCSRTTFGLEPHGFHVLILTQMKKYYYRRLLQKKNCLLHLSYFLLFYF